MKYRMSPSIASKVYINCLQTPSHHRKTYHLHQQQNNRSSESNGRTNGIGGINGCNGSATSNLGMNGGANGSSRPESRSSSPSTATASSWFPERFNNFFASMSPLHSKRTHHLNSPKPARARTGSISSNHESDNDCLTPPVVGSPSISSVGGDRNPPGTPLHWKSRLNATLKMSFLGTPRFHRRKMSGCSFGSALASGTSNGSEQQQSS